MAEPLDRILAGYDDTAPVEQAWTIPAAWYTDPRVAELERSTVWSRTWQMVGRAAQVAAPGEFVTAEVAGEPVVVVRGADGVLPRRFNVCRHHAAAVMTAPCGKVDRLRCPYHGWTYDLAGQLRGVPEFDGVRDFDRAAMGLAPVAGGTREGAGGGRPGGGVCLPPRPRGSDAARGRPRRAGRPDRAARARRARVLRAPRV